MFPEYNHYQSFNKVYSALQGKLAPLETERLEAQAKQKQSIFIIVTAVGLIAFGVVSFFLYKDPRILVPCLLIGIASIIYAGVQLHKKKQAYFEIIKGGLIPEIVSLVRSDLKYEPWDSIPGKEFFSTKLFNKQTDRYSGEDYLEGYLNDTHFRISEIKLEKERRDKDGDISHSTFFSGLLVSIEMPQMPKNGYARIESNDIGGFIGDFFSGLFEAELKKYETDNAKFNKSYKLFGNSTDMVNFIFTEHLIETIFQINENKNNIGVENELEQIAFVNGKAYFAIKHKQDLFLPQIKNSLQNQNTCKRFYDDLIFALDLVETITVK